MNISARTELDPASSTWWDLGSVMVLLVTSIHIIQITQNVISIPNFNLILDMEIESTEHTSRG